MATKKRTTKASKPATKPNPYRDRTLPRPNLEEASIHDCRPRFLQDSQAADSQDVVAISMHRRGVPLTEIAMSTGLRIDHLVHLLGLKDQLTATEIRELNEWYDKQHNISPVTGWKGF